MTTKRSGPVAARGPRREGGKGQMKHRAHDALNRLLVFGPLVPGTVLFERQPVRPLGMSNTPARAALGRLEDEGFVTISPRQGIAVRTPSIRKSLDHYELRDALESCVVRKVCGRLTREQAGRLRGNLEAQHASPDGRDFDRNVAPDGESHGLSCEFPGNEQVARVMPQACGKIHRVLACAAGPGPHGGERPRTPRHRRGRNRRACRPGRVNPVGASGRGPVVRRLAEGPAGRYVNRVSFFPLIPIDEVSSCGHHSRAASR